MSSHKLSVWREYYCLFVVIFRTVTCKHRDLGLLIVVLVAYRDTLFVSSRL